MLGGNGEELSTVPAAATWLARTVVLLAVGLTLLRLVVLGAAPFGRRDRRLLEKQLRSHLRAAADRLPADRRDLYLCEWEAELHEILWGRPRGRVLPALRYAVGP